MNWIKFFPLGIMGGVKMRLLTISLYAMIRFHVKMSINFVFRSNNEKKYRSKIIYFYYRVIKYDYIDFFSGIR